MGDAQFEFVWPGLPDAIPGLIIVLVLPAWLMWIVFKHMSFSTWKKVFLVPVCLIAPFLVTALWPLALKMSGIIGFTGPGDYQPPYGWYAQELFGRFSDYVWVSLTGLAILGFRGLLNSKGKDKPPSH